MTLVRAPIAGAVEWCCAPGQHVEAGAVLGWLAGPGRCGLVPMTAPTAGGVTWRRAAVLGELEAGAPGVVLGEDALAIEQAQAAEREAARVELARIDAELAALAARDDTPLTRALLEPQRTAAAARRATLVALLDDEAGGA